MKPERLTILLKWWADTRQKMLRSDKADIIRGAVKHANGQDYIPSDDGESLNIIEIFRSVMTAYEEASANGERERLSTAHEGLVYLSAMFEMLERGCEDGAISYACLEPDGAVSVTLAINPNGRGGSTAPILKHFLAVRRGGEKSAEAVHGSTSERSEKRAWRVADVKRLRTDGNTYTQATNEVGKNSDPPVTGVAIRKNLGPRGKRETKPEVGYS